MKINVLLASLTWVCLLPGASLAQSTTTQTTSRDGMAMHHDNDMNMNHMSMDHQHGLAVPVSYAELTKTAALLETAPTNPTVR
jgi:hypothetical protein